MPKYFHYELHDVRHYEDADEHFHGNIGRALWLFLQPFLMPYGSWCRFLRDAWCGNISRTPWPIDIFARLQNISRNIISRGQPLYIDGRPEIFDSIRRNISAHVNIDWCRLLLPPSMWWLMQGRRRAFDVSQWLIDGLHFIFTVMILCEMIDMMDFLFVWPTFPLAMRRFLLHAWWWLLNIIDELLIIDFFSSSFFFIFLLTLMIDHLRCRRKHYDEDEDITDAVKWWV